MIHPRFCFQSKIGNPESQILERCSRRAAELHMLPSGCCKDVPGGVVPEYVGTILAVLGQHNTPGRGASELLIDSLSEREFKVLRLLAAGLSNRAIAKHLVISRGAAKTHIHNIFGKLGASNRTKRLTA